MKRNNSEVAKLISSLHFIQSDNCPFKICFTYFQESRNLWIIFFLTYQLKTQKNINKSLKMFFLTI